MNEQFARVGTGIELCYETFGDPADETVLLIMGLATQMIAWDERFCALLVERGFHVVRFDNRDVGRSSRVEGRPPTVRELVLRDKKAARYTLRDMAGDALGLLDHLDVRRAHVVGASMGGMIAQTIAIEHPDRVLSLVSIMSNEGGRLKGQPALSVVPTFLRRAPRERNAYADYVAEMYGLIGSPGFPRDPEDIRQRARIAHDRGVTAAGSGRQLAAMLASPNRTAELRRLQVPALVVHGTKDRLINRSGGRAVAAAIPGAELLEIEGMGHDLPAGMWPRIVDGIAATAARARRDAITASPR
ncbi:MAG: alpha/beta fold hydrolase [Solirubrobacteraceae bacterium]